MSITTTTLLDVGSGDLLDLGSAVLSVSSTTQTCNTSPIDAYLYQQYFYDKDLQSLIGAFNGIKQHYVDWFLTASLPNYTALSGALLDWVGTGLYGVPRPILSTAAVHGTSGAITTYPVSLWPVTAAGTFSTITSAPVSDDIYQRVITWLFYKGDGFQFSTPWLKRRIYRFFYGINGADLNIDFTPNLSVTFDHSGVSVVCRIQWTGDQTNKQAFAALINAGILSLPFQFKYQVI